jgi:hypothetical protein
MGARPLTLRCTACKRARDWQGNETGSCTNLVATGRTKVVAKYGRFLNVTLYEIKHTCGHVMWSSHSQAKNRYNLWKEENR